MRDHGFHPLRVADVITETAEAKSFVLEPPADLRDAYGYQAGQFLTFRVAIEGHLHLRCYSMASAPAVDPGLKVTVKRVPGGSVSNWMNDNLAAGDVVEANYPAGVFCLGPGDADLVAFAAGSGITPVVSLVKEALATSSRRVRLLYANRDRDAVIFADELDGLVGRHPDRLEVVHHLDVDHGFVDHPAAEGFAAGSAEADYYICGPPPFMDVVESSLLGRDVGAGRIHVERFTPAEPPAAAEAAVDGPVRITIALDGRTETTEHRAGTTILQTARQAGLAPPFSCESGSCATCMARLEEGEVTMFVNNALTDDEVAEGWILTCQSVPTTPAVRVVYE